MKLQCILLSLILMLSSTCFADKKLVARKDVKDFIHELVEEDGFSEKYLQKILINAKPQASILHLIQRPYEAMPWHTYRRHFITESRIQHGVKFWKKNHKILAKVERDYGVPADIIVAILGVETTYGEVSFDYRVLDALVTLAFDYPPRSHFFRSELHEFLKLAKKHRINPRTTLGSYAGAMGMPQFMPSSLATYGVDYDHDGVIDLFKNPTDAIGSIANYLKRHGWQTHGKFAVTAKVTGNDYQTAIYRQDKRKRSKRLKPKYRIEHLQKRFAVVPTVKLNKDTRATLFTLAGDKHDEYWLGLNNFYVITTYNISKNYAMVVYELSKEIKRRYREDNLIEHKKRLSSLKRSKPLV